MKNTAAKKGLYHLLTVLERVLIGLVVIAAFINIVLFFKYKILNQSVPTFLGYSYVNVLSGSMEPTFAAGDLALCKESDEYHVGDAVLFEDDGYLILHRIVAANEDGSIATQGDANNTADENSIQPSQIYGKLIHVFPGWGETMAYLTSGLGALWTVLTCLLVFMVLDTGRELLLDSIDESNIVAESAAEEIPDKTEEAFGNEGSPSYENYPEDSADTEEDEGKEGVTENANEENL